MGNQNDKGNEQAKDWGYMRWQSIQSLYKELSKHSLENAVDALWINILQLYFKVEYNYASGTQAHPNRQAKTKADFVVRYVHNGLPRKVILIGNKSVCNESSDRTWHDAMEQLTDYMLHAVDARLKPKEDMYGIVTVGHYSRYYTLAVGSTTLTNFTSKYLDYSGEALHFKNDEYWMHTLLTELVERTRR
ncbi:hypothetical protein NOR_04891 [Metarhizium rileyi]|uniref:Uncharacterized protein n=1 Tax=Metarhizium rileyi (strain RCEF 4871) TaxID=1649241 RepID=A0A167DRF1_METRR|nr:hypothetical protein NOR_04891 [Metarhizium rileyi RCEF 4871]